MNKLQEIQSIINSLDSFFRVGQTERQIFYILTALLIVGNIVVLYRKHRTTKRYLPYQMIINKAVVVGAIVLFYWVAIINIMVTFTYQRSLFSTHSAVIMPLILISVVFSKRLKKIIFVYTAQIITLAKSIKKGLLFDFEYEQQQRLKRERIDAENRKKQAQDRKRHTKELTDSYNYSYERIQKAIDKY